MGVIADDMTPAFWAEKKVFLTGHTGFKGAWLAEVLHTMGADVTGYALAPQTMPSLFVAQKIDEKIRHIVGDIRDIETLRREIRTAKPDIVFHLAAQSLVRPSYDDPLTTIETNVLGTANVLDACRDVSSIRVVVVATSDKVYENFEWPWGYRETDQLGGSDPYSASKAAAEIISTSWRRSFLKGADVAVSTARAGNVVGGGDWSADRIIPDTARAFSSGEKLKIRSPNAVRPWQFVLDPLRGYMMLAHACWTSPDTFSGAWNFGPHPHAVSTVQTVVERFAGAWSDDGAWVSEPTGDTKHEANILLLDSAKSTNELGWRAHYDFDQTINETVDWYRAFYEHGAGTTLAQLTQQQIARAFSLERS